jgi:hypothetical protein
MVMRILGLTGAGVLLAALASGCGGTRTVVKTVTVQARATAMGDQRLYGEIRSLARKGDQYELRFDPAWFLTGVTANVAQAADQGTPCAPGACPPVADDVYVLDESHRPLVYIVPPTVRGTVLTKNGANNGPFPASTVTVARLAELVAGRGTQKLFEPLASGVWILVHGDTVRTFAQQYRP